MGGHGQKFFENGVCYHLGSTLASGHRSRASFSFSRCGADGTFTVACVNPWERVCSHDGMGGMKGVFSFETCTGWRALHLRGIWCILGSKRTNYRGPTTLRDARRRTKRRISYPRTPPERWHHSSVVAELFGTIVVASMKMTTKLPSIRGWRLVEAHWWWQHKPGIDGKGSWFVFEDTTWRREMGPSPKKQTRRKSSSAVTGYLTVKHCVVLMQWELNVSKGS